jgi:hypothetical protein
MHIATGMSKVRAWLSQVPPCCGMLTYVSSARRMHCVSLCVCIGMGLALTVLPCVCSMLCRFGP